MGKIEISIPHQLPQVEALNRIKKLLSEVKVKFADKVSDAQESWSGNLGKFSFSAMGAKVSGFLTVHR